MQKRNSKSKINGKIIMMQNDLMSKLANLDQGPRQNTDELGFASRSSQFDSLTNLLSKAKQVTTSNKDKIQVARKSSTTNMAKQPQKPKRKSQTGTFLTGIGLTVQQPPKTVEPIQDQQTRIIHHNYYENPTLYEQTDPDEMIREMIKKNQEDDLAQLRKMIKETSSSLDDYGKQLYRTRKEVLGMADKLEGIDYQLVDRIYRYEDKGY